MRSSRVHCPFRHCIWYDDSRVAPPVCLPPSERSDSLTKISISQVQDGGGNPSTSRLGSYEVFARTCAPTGTLDALKRLASEMVTQDGKDCLVAYQWRGRDPRGIYLTPLVWEWPFPALSWMMVVMTVGWS